MKKVLFLILSSFMLPKIILAGPKYGPLIKPFATTLAQEFGYFQKNTPTDFWTLMPYYQGMIRDHSAPVAAVVMVMNALRDQNKLTSSDENISEEVILKLEPTGQWKKNISGKKPKGVTPSELLNFCLPAVKKYLGDKSTVTLLDSESIAKMTDQKLHELFSENEANLNNAMVIHYIQSAFTDDPEGAVGNYSVIGAYNTETKRALILETDRKYYTPYWVSLVDVKTALTTLKCTDGKSGCGGIITIHK